MILREATRQDFVKLYGKPPAMTCRALALCDGDEPVAIGGYFEANGQAVVFSDLGKDLPKREIVKAAKEMMRFLKRTKMYLVAFAGPNGTTALAHFGFEPCGEVWRLS